MDANDIERMVKARETAKIVDRVNALVDTLEKATKSSYVADYEFDVYPYQVIADIHFENGHHIRVPFTVFNKTAESLRTLEIMIEMTGEL